jgi:hypothetical protein
LMYIPLLPTLKNLAWNNSFSCSNNILELLSVVQLAAALKLFFAFLRL